MGRVFGEILRGIGGLVGLLRWSRFGGGDLAGGKWEEEA